MTARKGGGEAQADADECLECGTCLADLRGVTGPIRQCQRGHLQCAHCFALLGGPEALCPTCEVPLGDIRNRLAEALRDMSVLRNAAGASGGGTAGSVDTGKRKTTETDEGLLSLLRATGLEQEAGHLAEHGFSCRKDVVAMREEDLPRLGMRFRPLLEGVESLRTQAVADAERASALAAGGRCRGGEAGKQAGAEGGGGPRPRRCTLCGVHENVHPACGRPKHRLSPIPPGTMLWGSPCLSVGRPWCDKCRCRTRPGRRTAVM